jgi:hypothetical protein
MIRLALGRRAFGWLPWPAGILAAIVIVCACAGPGREKPAPPSGGAPRAPGAAQGGAAVNLPMQAGVWTRADAPKRIDARTIFDYMDGGGELYVGYRFDHLDVYEYSSRDQGSILVELYWMTSRDEAFGLLSNDWGGEPIELDARTAGAPVPQVPPRRALFGGGLLRLWSDDLYARVLASRDTPASREQVIALGRAIVAGRSAPPPPALVRALPVTAAPGYRLRPDRVCFFRSYLVLNSIYFLSTQDILDLGPQVDAVTAQYTGPPKGRPPAGAPPGAAPKGPSLQVVVAVYPSGAAAERGLAHFRRAYLPEATGPVPDASKPEALKVEHGWVADGREGPTVVVALDCPNADTGRRMVNEVAGRVTRKGGRT